MSNIDINVLLNRHPMFISSTNGGLMFRYPVITVQKNLTIISALVLVCWYKGHNHIN